MTTINITTVQVGPYDLFGPYPGTIIPLQSTLGNLSASDKSTIQAGRLAGFSPVMVINLDTLIASIEMR